MFGKHIAHSLQRRASSNEVVEDDAVRLFGEIVHSEHRPDTLLGMAESNILVERDVQLGSNHFADASGEVLDEMATFGSGDDTPRPRVQLLTEDVTYQWRDAISEERHHTIVALDIRQRSAIQRLLP